MWIRLSPARRKFYIHYLRAWRLLDDLTSPYASYRFYLAWLLHQYLYRADQFKAQPFLLRFGLFHALSIVITVLLLAGNGIPLVAWGAVWATSFCTSIMVFSISDSLKRKYDWLPF